MDAELLAVLDELHRYGAEHDAGKADRLARLRNVEPDTARVLAVLVRATGARRVLEIGTSNGYSTLWLADAARSIGGQSAQRRHRRRAQRSGRGKPRPRRLARAGGAARRRTPP